MLKVSILSDLFLDPSQGFIRYVRIGHENNFGIRYGVGRKGIYYIPSVCSLGPADPCSSKSCLVIFYHKRWMDAEGGGYPVKPVANKPSPCHKPGRVDDEAALQTLLYDLELRNYILHRHFLLHQLAGYQYKQTR